MCFGLKSHSDSTHTESDPVVCGINDVDRARIDDHRIVVVVALSASRHSLFRHRVLIDVGFLILITLLLSIIGARTNDHGDLSKS